MPASGMMILDQNEAESRAMAAYFTESGYLVSCFSDYAEAMDGLSRKKFHPDVLIFGAAMPDKRIYDAIAAVRALSDVGLMVVSEDGRLESQLYAYSMKIDDYLVKPLPMPLLEAHVEALLRRTGERNLSMESVGEMSIDHEARKIYLAGRELTLTAKEFELMEFFIRHRGMILSRGKILDSVWGYDYVGGYRSVDTLVKKLRAKLTADYPYIRTVYGAGYCFDVPPEGEERYI